MASASWKLCSISGLHTPSASADERSSSLISPTSRCLLSTPDPFVSSGTNEPVVGPGPIGFHLVEMVPAASPLSPKINIYSLNGAGFDFPGPLEPPPAGLAVPKRKRNQLPAQSWSLFLRLLPLNVGAAAAAVVVTLVSRFGFSTDINIKRARGFKIFHLFSLHFLDSPLLAHI